MGRPVRAPRTAFSTELRGGSRAAKARLSNLFSAGKARAPLLVAAALALTVLAGGLVACNQTPLSPVITPAPMPALGTAQVWVTGVDDQAPSITFLRLNPVDPADAAALGALRAARFNGDDRIYADPTPVTMTLDPSAVLPLAGIDTALPIPALAFLIGQTQDGLLCGITYADGTVSALSPIPALSVTAEELMAAYLDHTGAPREQALAYWAQTWPGQKMRLARFTYAGAFPAYETMVLAYAADIEVYTEDGGQGRWSLSSLGDGDSYFFFNASADCADVYGCLGVKALPEGGGLEKAALEMACGVEDLEYTLTRDGWPGYYGLGSSDVACFREAPTTAPLDYDLIYQEGDFWESRTWDGVYAEFYVSPQSGGGLTLLETTRTDLYTYRGISVGDTRADVLAAYHDADTVPSAADQEATWGAGDDFLRYGSFSFAGLGPNLIFYFEDDVVTRIGLYNIFD